MKKHELKVSKFFSKIPHNLLRSEELSKNAKLLFCSIQSYNPAFPSYAAIARDTGIKSPTTISKAIKELIGFNIIKKTYRGPNQSPYYQIQCMTKWRIKLFHPPDFKSYPSKNGTEDIQKMEPINNKSNKNKQIKEIFNEGKRNENQD